MGPMIGHDEVALPIPSDFKKKLKIMIIQIGDTSNLPSHQVRCVFIVQTSKECFGVNKVIRITLVMKTTPLVQ